MRKVFGIVLIIVVSVSAYFFTELREMSEFHKMVLELEESNHSEEELNRIHGISVYLDDYKTIFRYGKNQQIDVYIKNISGNDVYEVGDTNIEIYYKDVWRRIYSYRAQALARLLLNPSDVQRIDCIDINDNLYNIPLKRGHYRLLVSVAESVSKDVEKNMYGIGEKDQFVAVEFDLK